jgi:hypothetical protein
MKGILLLGQLLAATAALAQSAPAQPLRETIISDKANTGWEFDGNPALKQIPAEDLPGGKAVLVTILAKGANPWDVQARLPMQQGISKGDTIVFGFFARAEQPDPGMTVAPVQVRMQRNAPPYDAALEGTIDIGPEWRFHCLTGPARMAITGPDLVAVVQLAGQKRKIVLGPYLVTRIPAGAAKPATGLPCGQSIPAS